MIEALRNGPSRAFVGLAWTGLLWGLVACGPDPADPKSAEQVLLDHAIDALWGGVAPDSVQSLRTRSILVEKNDGFSSTFELETLLGAAGEYRETRVWKDFGLREVFASAAGRSWYLVDGTRVESEQVGEEGPGRDQRWLFEVSKLAILKDGERFELKHEGEQALDDGTRVERLRVQDRERPDLSLALDIAQEGWLVRRVILDDGRGQHSFALLLDDYRSIEGLNFAHSIVSQLDGKHFASQSIHEIEINPELDPVDFRAPVGEAPLEVIRKDSIGGWLAWRTLDDEDAAEELPALKEWITQNGLEVAGPLLVLSGDPKAARISDRTPRLALAVKAPEPDVYAKLPPSEDSGLFELGAKAALCVTAVGPEKLAEGRRALDRALVAKGLTAAGPTIEVYFSRDGRIRQLQLPVN